MIRKTILVLLTFFSIFTFIDCCRSHRLSHEYEISDLSLTNLKFSYSNSIYNGSELSGNILDSTFKYGIRLNCVNSEIRTVNLRAYNLTGFDRAYACEDSWDYYKLSNSIESITIKTKNNFDSLHLANTDITDYFSIYYSDNASLIPLQTGLNTYLQGYTTDGALNEISNIDLFLSKKSVLDSVLQFDITIKFIDLTSITKVTDNIIQN